ncbi:MAG: triose-phosphate isomerase [Treponema sp.]|jgi:triosephosphate isomerase|nr:triose-phosphate isomerase [Treponema sp.]
MGRKLFIGTNTKMYKTIAQTVDFLGQLHSCTRDIPRSQICLFVIPSFTALQQARNTVGRDSILLGAQNMGWEDEGQFTGEISPVMLKEIGIDIIELGHSERRHVLHETDEEENKKARAALRHGFTALLCVGETGEQKKFGIADEILSIQLKKGLFGVSAGEVKNLWIAYEPVWAIGVQGKPATKEYAQEKHGVIRRTLETIFGVQAAKDIPILYGGSVNNENAPGLIQMENVDGLFIGRSAWQADNFSLIIRETLPLFARKAGNQ